MNLRSVLFITFSVSAIAGLTAAVTAQRVPEKTPVKVQAKSVTLTGCVAQGVDANHYELANAVRTEDPPASAAVAGSSPTVRSDKRGADDRTGRYDLEGGEFKARLGQRVEVTGTGGNTDLATTTTPTASTEQKQSLPRFNVVSVKTLSATCS